jgi:hypothetical protein
MRPWNVSYEVIAGPLLMYAFGPTHFSTLSGPTLQACTELNWNHYIISYWKFQIM